MASIPIAEAAAIGRFDGNATANVLLWHDNYLDIAEEFIFNEEQHNLGELHLLFLAIRKAGNMFPLTRGSPLHLTWRRTPGAWQTSAIGLPEL